MFKSALRISLLFVLLPGAIRSQNSGEKGRFFTVDSISKTVKYKHDIYRLTKELTDRYPEQMLKARAIFIWITNNIEYDYKFINKGKEITIPECDPGVYCDQLLRGWQTKYLYRVLRRKKAICDGYARLYKVMCGIAGLRCEIVSGYTRSEPYQVGNTGSLDHSWNAVYIDSAYYFVDPTWAAGGCFVDPDTGELLFFVKSFKEYYWCTPFHDLARNHYPQEAKWVFEPNYTREKFAANPYYRSTILSDINLLSPTSGIINAAKGDTIHFKFTYKQSVNYMQVNSNIFRNPQLTEWVKKPWRRGVWKSIPDALKKQQYIPFRQNGDTYEFDYIVSDSSLYYIDLLFDYERVMKFNVNIAGPQPGE